MKFPESSAHVLGSQVLSYETLTNVGVKNGFNYIVKFLESSAHVLGSQALSYEMLTNVGVKNGFNPYVSERLV